MRSRTSLAVAVPGLALALAGCHDHDHDDEPTADEFFFDCESSPAGATVFATDEAFVEFVNKEAANGLTKDDAQAPKLTSPAAGGTISAATPPMFTFMNMPTARLDARPGRRTGPCPVRRSRWAAARAFFSLEGTAYAHCPAVSGENFLFRLTKEGDSKPLYTALLSVTSFTPSAAKWNKALAGRSGQTVTLTLARAVLSKGTITNGPFVPATAIKFTVGP
jgi:hypothetical protein